MSWCYHHDKVIARVHSVHLTNAGQRQAAADHPPSQPTWAVSPPRLLSFTFTVAIIILLSPKADALLPFHKMVEG